MSDDALFRDREAETLLFLLEHPEQPGLAELTTSGAGDTLSRKAGLHLRLSLRKGAFVVADWVKETVAKVQPAAAATSTGAGLLPAAQAQQVTQIMQQVTNSGGAQLKAEFEVKLKAEMAKMQEEVAASHEVGEQIQLGMQSIAGAHALNKRRNETGEEMSRQKKMMTAMRQETKTGLVPAAMQEAYDAKKLEYEMLNKCISANDPRSVAVFDIWDRERKCTGGAAAAFGKASKLLDEELKAKSHWGRVSHQSSQFGGQGLFAAQSGHAGWGQQGGGHVGGQQFGGFQYGGQYGGQLQSAQYGGAQGGAQFGGNFAHGGAQGGGAYSGAQGSMQYGGAVVESFAAPAGAAQMGAGIPPPPPINAPGGPSGNLGRQPYAPPATSPAPRFHTLSGGDVRLISTDGTRLVNLKLGRSQEPPFFLYKNLGLAQGEVRSGGGPCNYCGQHGHECFECAILRGWFRDGNVNAQGHPTRRW